MVTAHELAASLVKAAGAVGRLGFEVGPEDRRFRELVIGEMVHEMPIPRPLDCVREQLLADQDPAALLSRAFAQQVTIHTEAAARATVAVVASVQPPRGPHVRSAAGLDRAAMLPDAAAQRVL